MGRRDVTVRIFSHRYINGDSTVITDNTRGGMGGKGLDVYNLQASGRRYQYVEY